MVRPTSTRSRGTFRSRPHTRLASASSAAAILSTPRAALARASAVRKTSTSDAMVVGLRRSSCPPPFTISPGNPPRGGGKLLLQALQALAQPSLAAFPVLRVTRAGGPDLVQQGVHRHTWPWVQCTTGTRHHGNSRSRAVCTPQMPVCHSSPLTTPRAVEDTPYFEQVFDQTALLRREERRH